MGSHKLQSWDVLEQTGCLTCTASSLRLRLLLRKLRARGKLIPCTLYWQQSKWATQFHATSRGSAKLSRHKQPEVAPCTWGMELGSDISDESHLLLPMHMPHELCGRSLPLPPQRLNVASTCWHASVPNYNLLFKSRKRALRHICNLPRPAQHKEFELAQFNLRIIF